MNHSTKVWKASIGDCPSWWSPRPYYYGIKHLSKKPWFYCTSNCAHDVNTNHSKCESFSTNMWPKSFYRNLFLHCALFAPASKLRKNMDLNGKTKGSSWWVSPHARVRDWPLAPEVEILPLLVRSTWAKQPLFQHTAHGPGGIGWKRLWVVGQRTTNVQSAGMNHLSPQIVYKARSSFRIDGEHGCHPKKGLVVMNHSTCNSKRLRLARLRPSTRSINENV